jgi:hypothetical protein
LGLFFKKAPLALPFAFRGGDLHTWAVNSVTSKRHLHRASGVADSRVGAWWAAQAQPTLRPENASLFRALNIYFAAMPPCRHAARSAAVRAFKAIGF